MKQAALASGNISGAVAGASVTSETKWQGGDGWLVVVGFNAIAGAPVLNVTSSEGSLPGIANPITASGVYPFYAPKDVSILCEFVAQPGEQMSFSSIYFLGNV